MTVFTKILGVLIVLGGVVLGVWIDVFVMLFGGIQLIVAGLNADPMNSSDIGWGVIHLVFCGIGAIVAVVVVMLGAAMFKFGRFARPRKRKLQR